MENLAKKLIYDDGYTHIEQIKNKKIQKLEACNYSEFYKQKDKYKNEKDVYATVNTFSSPRRRTNPFLWQLRRLFIDIDYTKKDDCIDTHLIALEVEELVRQKKIPQPSEYIFSGRGMHIYWDIEDCHAMLQDLWDKIENHLYTQIKTLEDKIANIKIDRQAVDPTRIMRVTGTINSKNNELCYSMLKRKNIYNIFDLKKEYIKIKPKNSKGRSNLSYLPTKNLYTLNASRVKDLVKLVKLRNGEVEGYRNALIVLYSYHYRLINDITQKELIEEVSKYNNMFKAPLLKREIKDICRCVCKAVKLHKEDNKKGYNYRTKSIIAKLDIAEEEQHKLITLISTKVKYERNNKRRNNNRRNEEGLTSREQQKRDLTEEIKKLKNEGYKYTEIAEKLNISVNTVKYHNRKK